MPHNDQISLVFPSPPLPALLYSFRNQFSVISYFPLDKISKASKISIHIFHPKCLCVRNLTSRKVFSYSSPQIELFLPLHVDINSLCLQDIRNIFRNKVWHWPCFFWSNVLVQKNHRDNHRQLVLLCSFTAFAPWAETTIKPPSNIPKSLIPQ